MFNLNNINITLLDILLFYFCNLLVATISKRYLTYKGLQIFLIINNFILTLSCVCLWTFFIFYYNEESYSFKLNSNNWVNINYEILLKINSLNFLFILLVSVIGTATNFYIWNYFKYEERGEEFVLLINWFIFSMIFLVMGNNFFSLILGWELIGLTSFLLINFWRFKISTLECSFKAFTFNKISDIFLMIGLCLLWNSFKTSNVDTIITLLNLNSVNNGNILTKAGFCIIVSSCIKSAQIIGHLWLPDSMEAPVPASSLIHSATLVSAGIYLLLKFYIIFSLTKLTELIFFIGSITACYGGIVAASQTDMKKLLAYSTISHCGFIFASISLNNFLITTVYLYLHGLFKAVTFFCAGSIIKSSGSQDTRLMGYQKFQLFNAIVLLIASINLGGLPFTFGYLYKYLFLKYLIITPLSIIGYGLNIIGMLCSVVYVYKLVYYSCFDFRKGPFLTLTHLIQNNESWVDKTLFNSTLFKFIGFILIYSFSCLFFIVITLFFLKQHIILSSYGKIFLNDYLFISNFFFIYKHSISLFYILFSAICTTLFSATWREIFFYNERTQMWGAFLFLIVNSIMWSRIINTILFYMI